VVTQALTCPNCQAAELFPGERYCEECGHDTQQNETPAVAAEVAVEDVAEAPAEAPVEVPAGGPATVEAAAVEAQARTPVAPTPTLPVCANCAAPEVDSDGYCGNCGHAQPRPRDHMEDQGDAVAVVSNRGYRHHRNEDSFAVGGTVLPDGTPVALAVVCDGVSSASRPDEASEAAARAACDHLHDALSEGRPPEQAMNEAVFGAAEAVRVLDRPAGSRNAPACTLVSSMVFNGEVVVGWVGDSRVYWIPDDRASAPELLTEDDSWAVGMISQGLMTKAEAFADHRAHAITGWLGADNDYLDPHTARYRPRQPGVVLVCTDGLWNYAETAESLAAAVPANARTEPLSTARHLVDFALAGGGHDNITVAVLPFEPRRPRRPVPAVGSAAPTRAETPARSPAQAPAQAPTPAQAPASDGYSPTEPDFRLQPPPPPPLPPHRAPAGDPRASDPRQEQRPWHD
jgi:serine/threonine protein phosphatase PrpC